MAARLWLLLLGADLALSILAAYLIAGRSPHARVLTAMLAAVLFVLIPWALTTISVLAAARSNKRPLSVALARVVLRECAYFTRLVSQIVFEPLRGSPEVAAPDSAPARPVLLLHGIVCNRGIWRGWLRALRTAGFAPVRALTLEPLFADLDAHAARVAEELASLQRESHGARVTLLAHSMGGLIARAALPLAGPSCIRRIITLACPHHGSRVARHFASVPTRQMRPESPWLAALNAAQEEHWAVPVTSIWSTDDNLVVPARSADLAGADCQPLNGCGHVGLLGSRAALTRVLAALAAG